MSGMSPGACYYSAETCNGEGLSAKVSDDGGLALYLLVRRE